MKTISKANKKDMFIIDLVDKMIVNKHRVYFTNYKNLGSMVAMAYYHIGCGINTCNLRIASIPAELLQKYSSIKPMKTIKWSQSLYEGINDDLLNLVADESNCYTINSCIESYIFKPFSLFVYTNSKSGKRLVVKGSNHGQLALVKSLMIEKGVEVSEIATIDDPETMPIFAFFPRLENTRVTYGCSEESYNHLQHMLFDVAKD